MQSRGRGPRRLGERLRRCICGRCALDRRDCRLGLRRSGGSALLRWRRRGKHGFAGARFAGARPGRSRPGRRRGRGPGESCAGFAAAEALPAAGSGAALALADPVFVTAGAPFAGEAFPGAALTGDGGVAVLFATPVAVPDGIAVFEAAGVGRASLASPGADPLACVLLGAAADVLATGDADLARSRPFCFCTDVSPIPVYRWPDCRIKDFVTSFGDQSMSCSDSCKPMPITSAIPGGRSRPSAIRRQAAFAAAGVAACLLSACSSAGDANHPLRGAAQVVGLATTVGEPKDFVKASRSGSELAYVPIGRGGIERPVAARNLAGVRSLESELDSQRDAVEATARRPLPSGAYGQPLPSVAAPPRPSSGPAVPASGQPESAPVSASRLRQIRENAERARTN